MRSVAGEYELVSPGTLSGVLELMAAEPGAWMPIAGGTELMVQFGAGRLAARKLVNIFGLAELVGIGETADWVSIGAGTTYTQLRRSAVVAAEFRLLARSAGWTGSIANQNRGTLGGNVVNGSPAADSPPALLAYEAELELVSARGSRRVPYAEFHTGYKRSVLAKDELVLGVHLPRGRTHGVEYLRKVGPRNAQAISKVALGAVGSVVDGRVAGVRLGLASVSSAPLRCVATEAYLNGRGVGELAGARECLMGEIAPLDDVRSTGEYRAQVAGNLLEEFLGQLVGSASGFEGWNRCDRRAAGDVLRSCCGSPEWVRVLVERRPFAGFAEWMVEAEAVWFGLPEAEWLKAFACHPRIGERKAAVETTAQFASWSAAEQGAAQASLDDVAEALAKGNRAYEHRFGFMYIVFARGRSAPELLGVLEERLGNTREAELQEAARQQWAITKLRLGRMLGADG